MAISDTGRTLGQLINTKTNGIKRSVTSCSRLIYLFLLFYFFLTTEPDDRNQTDDDKYDEEDQYEKKAKSARL